MLESLFFHGLFSTLDFTGLSETTKLYSDTHDEELCVVFIWTRFF